MCKFGGPRITKTLLKKNKKVEELILLQFITCYKAIVIKTVWYWHKDRHIEQWDRIESAKIYPYIYGQLNFTRKVKTT